MSRRVFVWTGALLGLALSAYLAFGYFGIQTLFIDTVVDEPFPVSAAQPQTAAPTVPPATAAPTAEPTLRPAPATARTTAPTAAAAPTAEPTALPPTPEPTALPPTPEPTAEPTPPPPAEPVLIGTGQFHAVDHAGVGSALIYRQPDGSLFLRFENFDIEGGPDAHIYAVAAPDSYDAPTVLNAGYVYVAPLKGNQGNQNYTLPPGFDPAIHRSITIWCERFTMNMVTAPLADVR